MIKWLLSTMVKGSSSMGQKGGAPPALNSNDTRQISNSLTDELSKIMDKSLNSGELNRLSDRMKGLLTGMRRVTDPETVKELERTASSLGNKYFHTFYKEEERVVRELKRQKPNILESDVRAAFRDRYEEPQLPESAAVLGQSKNHHMRQFGMAMLGYVFQQIIQSATQYDVSRMMTQAGIERTQGMAFSNQGGLQDYLQKSSTGMQNTMSLLELEKQRKSLLYGSVGSGIGMAAGTVLGYATGGMFSPTLAAVGGFLGNTIGSSFAERYGTQDITKEMAIQTPQMQFNQIAQDWMGLSGPRVDAFQNFDIRDMRTKARFGNIGIVGRGLGYDDGTLRSLQYGMGSIAGYDENAFLSQTAFSRAQGLSPEEVYQANISTRYTGQRIGATELTQRKNLANTIGMGDRVPEVIQGMNKLAEVFARVDNHAGESGMMKSAALLSTIYGDTEKGRIGTQLGMETFGQLQGMFQQAPGSAGDAFMFNALRGQHKGNLREFQILKEKGITNPDTFRSVLQQIEKYGPEKGYFAFEGLGLSATNANLLSEKIKTTEGGVEGVMKEWDEKNKAIEKNTGGAKDVLDSILNDAVNKTSKTEKFQATLLGLNVVAGTHLFNIHSQIKLQDTKKQNEILENRQLQDTILGQMKASWDVMVQNVENIVSNKLGVDAIKGAQDPNSIFFYNMLSKDKEKQEFAAKFLVGLGTDKYKIWEGANIWGNSNRPGNVGDLSTITVPLRNDPAFPFMADQHITIDAKALGIDTEAKKAALMKNIDETLRKEDISGHAEGKSGITNHFHLAVDSNNLDNTMGEIRGKIQEQIALMARPYKRR